MTNSTRKLESLSRSAIRAVTHSKWAAGGRRTEKKMQAGTAADDHKPVGMEKAAIVRAPSKKPCKYVCVPRMLVYRMHVELGEY